MNTFSMLVPVLFAMFVSAVCFAHCTVTNSTISQAETRNANLSRSPLPGNYSLNSDRKAFEDLMKLMGFKEEDIIKYQGHATAGNLQVKVLNNALTEIEMTEDSPLGKHRMTFSIHERQDLTIWDGRVFKVKMGIGDVDEKRAFLRTHVKLDGVFSCELTQLFDPKGFRVLHKCMNQRAECYEYDDKVTAVQFFKRNNS